MGMYTDFCFDCELKADTPPEVITLLQAWMDNAMGHYAGVHRPLPDHALFRTPRWHMIGWCGSAYFSAQPHRSFEKLYDSTWTLNIRSNHKNYDNEIELFIDWINPYIVAAEGDFLGFYRYEENQHPTLIFYEEPL